MKHLKLDNETDLSATQYTYKLEEKLQKLEKSIEGIKEKDDYSEQQQNSQLQKIEAISVNTKNSTINNICSQLKQKQMQKQKEIERQKKEQLSKKKVKHVKLNVMKLQDKSFGMDKNIYNITFNEVLLSQNYLQSLENQIARINKKIKKAEGTVQRVSEMKKQVASQTKRLQHSLRKKVDCGKIKRRSVEQSINLNPQRSNFDNKQQSTFFKWNPPIQDNKSKEQTQTKKLSLNLREYSTIDSNFKSEQLTTNRITPFSSYRSRRHVLDTKVHQTQSFRRNEINNNQNQTTRAQNHHVIFRNKGIDSNNQKTTRALIHHEATINSKKDGNQPIKIVDFDQDSISNQERVSGQSRNEDFSYESEKNKQPQNSLPNIEEDFWALIDEKLKLPKQFPLEPPSEFNAKEQNDQLAIQAYQMFGFRQILKTSSPRVSKYHNGVRFDLKGCPKIIWYYDGSFYIGDWQENLSNEGYKDGQGLQYIPGKFLYKGCFKQGKRQGKGTIKIYFQNDTVILGYHGQWKDNKAHGFGFQVQKKGAKFIGNFVNGQKIGQCTMRTPEGGVFEGNVSEGAIKEGEGKQVLSNKDEFRGQYSQNKFCGKGKYTWKNGNTYQGQFKSGRRNGQGILKYANGDIFTGIYIDDKKQGQGKYEFNNGQVYEGQFQNDLKHGKGYYSYPNGKVALFLWKNDRVEKRLYSEQEQFYRKNRNKK